MQTKIIILIALITIEIPTLIIFGARGRNQPGFVITNKGDTLFCTVRNLSEEYLDIRTTGNLKYHREGIDSVKEYNLTRSHQTYRAVFLPDALTPRYLRLLVDGKISLYEYSEQIGKYHHLHLYASKLKQPLVKVYGYNSDKDNGKQLDQLIEDNPEARDYLANQHSYSNSVIENCIRIYNKS